MICPQDSDIFFIFRIVYDICDIVSREEQTKTFKTRILNVFFLEMEPNLECWNGRLHYLLLLAPLCERTRAIVRNNVMMKLNSQLGNTDGSRLTMVELVIFQLYSSVKATYISQKHTSGFNSDIFLATASRDQTV